MDLLRTLTSALAHYDPDASDNSPQANYRKAVRLTAQISSIVATMGPAWPPAAVRLRQTRCSATRRTSSTC